MRLSPGPFTNVDWLYELRNSRAFAHAQSLAASVGNFSEVQLFNPVASGITIIVHRIIGGLEAIGYLYVAFFNTALTTLAFTAVNLNNGAAAGQGQIRTAQPAAADGTAIRQIRVPAQESWVLADDWFGVLGAGEGILVRTAAVNLALAASFDWIEF